MRVVAMYCACSFSFLHISLAAGHHHPAVWHAGDTTYPVHMTSSKGPAAQAQSPQQRDPPLQDSNSQRSIDWGVFQLLSVGRRPAIDSSLPRACVSFGMHQLHHLFPTVDHSRLPLLEELLRDTCREFGLDMFSDPSAVSDAAVSPLDDSNAQAWGARRTFTIVGGWVGMVTQVGILLFNCRSV